MSPRLKHLLGILVLMGSLAIIWFLVPIVPIKQSSAACALPVMNNSACMTVTEFLTSQQYIMYKNGTPLHAVR